MFDRVTTRRRTLGRADPCGSRDRGCLDRGFGSEHLGNVPRTALFELADGSVHGGEGVAFDLVLDNAKLLEPGSLKRFGRRADLICFDLLAGVGSTEEFFADCFASVRPPARGSFEQLTKQAGRKKRLSAKLLSYSVVGEPTVTTFADDPEYG